MSIADLIREAPISEFITDFVQPSVAFLVIIDNPFVLTCKNCEYGNDLMRFGGR